MVRTVWKAQLKYDFSIQDITVPAGAVLLCVKAMPEGISVWFHCNPDQPSEVRKIAVVPTGSLMPDVVDADRHIGTAIVGRLVYHVFELQS